MGVTIELPGIRVSDAAYPKETQNVYNDFSLSSFCQASQFKDELNRFILGQTKSDLIDNTYFVYTLDQRIIDTQRSQELFKKSKVTKANLEDRTLLLPKDEKIHHGALPSDAKALQFFNNFLKTLPAE